MDDNTTKVLLAIISLISAVVTPLVVVYVANRTNKKVAIVESKVAVVDSKLDHNFEQANGHFTKLLETTAKLSKEEGRQEQRANPKKGNL